MRGRGGEGERERDREGEIGRVCLLWTNNNLVFAVILFLIICLYKVTVND